MDESSLQEANSMSMRSTISSEPYRQCRKIFEIARGTSSSGKYLQSKRIAEQNSNREQEVLPEKEKEEATKGLLCRRSMVVRKYLLVAAMCVVTTSYLAGVSPPGGFWSDNGGTRLPAGDPMHQQVTIPGRYKAFFFCNATAYIISILVLCALIRHDASKDSVKHSRNQPIVPKLTADFPRFCSQSDPAADKDGPDRAAIMHNSSEDTWYADSGVSHHATSNQSLLQAGGGYSPVDDRNGEGIVLRRANGEVLQVRGRGSVSTKSIKLDDVWYVPGLDSNLVSIGQLARQGCAITLGPDGCRITRGGALVGSARFTDSDRLELDFVA